MGNWIRNTIEAKGISNLDIFTNDNVDFNKITPEPASEAECPKDCLFTKDNAEHIMPSEDKPWFNWSKWRTTNWGVDMNAVDTNKVNNNTIQFDVKWNAPYIIIAKLSKMLGDVELTHTYNDIDQIFAPVIKTVWRDGKMVKAYETVYNNETETYDEFEEIETTDRFDYTEVA